MPRPGLGTWKIMFFLGKRSIEILEIVELPNLKMAMFHDSTDWFP